MDRSGSDHILLFNGFRLDRRAGGLFRQDQVGNPTPVLLGARALDLLALLAGRQGELVSKDEIMTAVWPGRAVEEANLNVQISKLRHILDQNRREGSCIQTVTGYGYRFTADTTRIGTEALAETRPRDDGVGAVSDRADAHLSRSPAGLTRASVDGRVKPGSVVASLIVGFGLLALLIAAMRWHPSLSQEASSKPPLLSIVVLPFANLGGDGEQQYFADSITEDLTTDLSQIAEMFVISHNTALTYRDRSVDTQQVGRELGVRYVLEGTVQQSGRKIRINTQLSATENAANLWSQRFDSDTSDLFALQNEITRRIAVAINARWLSRQRPGRPSIPTLSNTLLEDAPR
jgi:TolB-like protein/DNA-binding winged helix-turn-helix (wHTH) protein